MAWLVLVVVVVVVVLATNVVLPRRDRLGRAPGFPWFWAVFPATCIAVAAAVAVFAWPEMITAEGSLWRGSPGSEASGYQFLSGEQYQRFVTLRRLRRVLPAVSAVGIVLCVWAWRRRRI